MSQTTTDDGAALIRRVADDAGFDDHVGDLAVQVFRIATDDGPISPGVDRGDGGKFTGDGLRFPDEVYAAAVYAAARVRDVPTKPADIATAFDGDVDEDTIVRYYKAMLSALPYSVEPEDPADWVRRLCDDMGFGDAFEVDALSLASDAVDAGLHIGKSVSGFAAAVVYATTEIRDVDVLQGDVASAASVSPTTIRNQYRDVMAVRGDVSTPGDASSIDAAINDLCDRIDGLPGRVRADALELAADASEADADFVRRTDPKGVASGFVYVAAKDDRVDVSQTEVADVAGVSKSTVVNRVVDVRDWRNRAAFDDVNYNRLKELAADAGLDVGIAPERDYLVDRLADAGVEL